MQRFLIFSDKQPVIDRDAVSSNQKIFNVTLQYINDENGNNCTYKQWSNFGDNDNPL